MLAYRPTDRSTDRPTDPPTSPPTDPLIPENGCVGANKVPPKFYYLNDHDTYVLSARALSRFSHRRRGTCVLKAMKMSRCLDVLGVTSADSRDALGRNHFHAVQMEVYVHRVHRLHNYAASIETENVSDYVISFDDVGPERMHALEYFVYHLKPYGIIRGLQQLNPAGNTPTV
ncbi:hypothetical protein LSAT2_025737 [Lamellibrachia satsuma]|nr:hypothetical protein LSAT2_025737 [Lamellibrachia satsuma]